MPDIFTLVARHVWLAALAMGFLNAAAFQRRFRPHIAAHPERAPGYRRFLIGFVVINTLLWSLMGLGIVVGGVPGVFGYFNPAAGSPFVLAWHAALVALWLLGIWWMYLRGGAEFIAAHPGLLNHDVTNPALIRLWFGACLAGGVIAEVMMWTRGASFPMP